MVLGVFVCFFLYLNYSAYFFSLIYLTFTACEGALGLTILVSIARTNGGDYFRSFSLIY